jgi:hypothetical protein
VRLRSRHPVGIDEAVVAAVVAERLPDGRLMPKVESPKAVAARVGERTVTAERLGKALGARWKGVANEQAALAAKAIVLDRLVQGADMAEAQPAATGTPRPGASCTPRPDPRHAVPEPGRREGHPRDAGGDEGPGRAKESSTGRRACVRQVTVAARPRRSAGGAADRGRHRPARASALDRRLQDAGGDRGWQTPKETEEPEAALLGKPGDVPGPTAAPEGSPSCRSGPARAGDLRVQ